MNQTFPPAGPAMPRASENTTELVRVYKIWRGSNVSKIIWSYLPDLVGLNVTKSVVLVVRWILKDVTFSFFGLIGLSWSISCPISATVCLEHRVKRIWANSNRSHDGPFSYSWFFLPLVCLVGECTHRADQRVGVSFPALVWMDLILTVFMHTSQDFLLSLLHTQ